MDIITLQGVWETLRVIPEDYDGESYDKFSRIMEESGYSFAAWAMGGIFITEEEFYSNPEFYNYLEDGDF